MKRTRHQAASDAKLTPALMLLLWAGSAAAQQAPAAAPPAEARLSPVTVTVTRGVEQRRHERDG